MEKFSFFILFLLLLFPACSQKIGQNVKVEKTEQVFCSDIDLAVESVCNDKDSSSVRAQLVNRGRYSVEAVSVTIKRDNDFLGYTEGHDFWVNAPDRTRKMMVIQPLETDILEFYMDYSGYLYPPTHVNIAPVIMTENNSIVCNSITNGFKEISAC